MKLPKVRWPVVVENAVGLVGYVLMTFVVLLCGAVLVAVYITVGMVATIFIGGIVAVVLTPLWVETDDEPRYLTPENRTRLLEFMRGVKARCRKQD